MSDQYFLPEHYAAFIPPKPDLDDEATRKERIAVQKLLVWLGDQIWHRILLQNSKGKKYDIHQHHQTGHHCSSYHFITLDDGTPMVDHIGSMWYHFGKSLDQLTAIERLVGGSVRYKEKDISQRAFYLHTRVQIYISAEEVRCWLVLATDKNYYDRKVFKERLVKDKKFKDLVWAAIQRIVDKGYFYEIDGNQLPLTSDLPREDFFRFIIKDPDGVYSGIAKSYLQGDARLSRDTIVDEMWGCMQDLYPLYDLMSYRLVLPGSQPDVPKSNPAQKYDGLFGGAAKITTKNRR